MICPVCGEAESRVIRSTKDWENSRVLRIRECPRCETVWATTETPNDQYYQLQQNNGMNRR